MRKQREIQQRITKKTMENAEEFLLTSNVTLDKCNAGASYLC